MADLYIDKARPDPEGVDFDALRKEGIRIIQEISGDIWTDYNLHDPGVTMLEAVCYALTDLVYRTGFDVADYLAAEDGSIDFRRQVLYRPDEIFPTLPVTERDYRKLILSLAPDIDNVWVRPEEGGMQGLYRIYVLPSTRVGQQDDEAAARLHADRVRRLYLENRNLCEDLAGVEIVERIPYTMCGEIEIGGKREPAKILAEIHHKCSQYLCPEVPRLSYMEEYEKGKPLEELFDGVLAGPGYIDDAALYPWQGSFSVADLIGRVARIEGVKSVHRLMFVDANGHQRDTIILDPSFECRKVACLRHDSREEEGIRFVKAGKWYHVSSLDVEEEVKRLEYKRRVSRRQKRHFDWVATTLPRGSFRNIREYYSMQNHLPDIYGLNVYGVPDSAPAERKAQAAQLKAYLMFFDQVMANFLEILQQTPRLFSLDEGLHQSYFHQVLYDDELPGAEGLYPDGAEAMGENLARLMAPFDDHADRRNRMLDYLLGLYGESFVQSSLRHFSHESVDFEERCIENKIDFLKDIVDITGRRFTAFDYSRPAEYGANTCALKEKLAHLLGMKRRGGGGSPEDDYHLVEHILLRPSESPSYPGESMHDDFYASRISFIFPDGSAAFPGGEFRKLVEETIRLISPAHIHAQVHWLKPERMRRFVSLHEQWLREKREPADFSGGPDRAAGRLRHFLRDIEGHGGTYVEMIGAPDCVEGWSIQPGRRMSDDDSARVSWETGDRGSHG